MGRCRACWRESTIRIASYVVLILIILNISTLDPVAFSTYTGELSGGLGGAAKGNGGASGQVHVRLRSVLSCGIVCTRRDAFNQRYISTLSPRSPLSAVVRCIRCRAVLVVHRRRALATHWSEAQRSTVTIQPQQHLQVSVCHVESTRLPLPRAAVLPRPLQHRHRTNRVRTKRVPVPVGVHTILLGAAVVPSLRNIVLAQISA